MKGLYLKYSVGDETFVTGASDENIDISVTATDKITVKVTAKRDIKLVVAGVEGLFNVGKDDRVFLNGYQSWTDSKEFYLYEKERDVNKLPKILVKKFGIDKYGDACFYDYSREKLHGYDVFYSRGEKEIFILNDNYKIAYLVAEVNRGTGLVSLRSDFDGKALAAGESLAVLDYYIAESFSSGIELFNRVYPKKDIPKVFGYTSWYNYYQNIDEKIILRDLEGIDGKFDLFQIDDGYEKKVGDWLSVDEEKFPNGLSGIVGKIHDKGLKAGIWLAPFVAEEESAIYAEHRDWFKKGEDGLPVKCGGNWSGFYALDLENAEAVAYIKKCLTHYADMGFDFFKLDFLYAASLPLYEGRTRSETAEKAYSILRETLGDKTILGCGATIFNSIGKFDYLRIGPDVSLSFDDKWFMRFTHRERISTKRTLQNTVYRSFMDGRFFGCDPDVFLLRDDNVRMNDGQKEALITLNALFGSVLMTSDNVGEYDDEKKKLLSEAENLRGAEVTRYERKGKNIIVGYILGGVENEIKYDTEKGWII